MSKRWPDSRPQRRRDHRGLTGFYPAVLIEQIQSLLSPLTD
jgi:hypothetical protein